MKPVHVILAVLVTLHAAVAIVEVISPVIEHSAVPGVPDRVRYVRLIRYGRLGELEASPRYQAQRIKRVVMSLPQTFSFSGDKKGTTVDHTTSGTPVNTASEAPVVTAPEAKVVRAPEPSEVTGEEASEVTGEEASEVTAQEASEVIAPELSEVTAPEPSEFTAPDTSAMESTVEDAYEHEEVIIIPDFAFYESYDDADDLRRRRSKMHSLPAK